MCKIWESLEYLNEIPPTNVGTLECIIPRETCAQKVIVEKKCLGRLFVCFSQKPFQVLL